MTFDAGKVSLYGTTGVLVAVLIIASMLFSGLRLPTFVPSTGTLIIKLTDAPVELDQLNVTIDDVSVHGKEGDLWVNLPFIDDRSNVTLDLLTLQNVTTDLCIDDISAGNYTMIKLHIAAANATYAGEVEPVEINVPSDAIKVIIPFEIKNGELEIVLIDMGVDLVAISESKNLRPVLKAMVI